MSEIVLSKGHGGSKAGTRLTVLAPGQEIKEKSVDALRAAAMVEAKIAKWVEVPHGEEG